MANLPEKVVCIDSPSRNQIDRKVPKHYTMYLMSKDATPLKEIAQALNTNVGHVWNELNKYKLNPSRAKKYAN